jgi:DNA-binding response OmpR family regulator
MHEKMHEMQSAHFDETSCCMTIAFSCILMAEHCSMYSLQGNQFMLPPYDLVIIDLKLPGELSGQEVILRIRKVLPPERFPIIVISGAGEPQVAQLRHFFPDISFIQKPFKLQMLEMGNELQP